MRWQKTARLAIAVFVIVFAAVVFVALRRPGPPVRVHESTPREREGSLAETRSTPGAAAPVYTSTGPDGKVRFRIPYDKMAVYPNGRYVFTNGTITLPDRDGRTVTIAGGEIEAMVPQNEATPLDTVKLTRGVKLNTSDGLEVTSDNATYDEQSGMVSVPGEVHFKKGRLTGSGFGATYDRGRDVLWLLDRARMQVVPDEQGKGAAEATAGAAGLARPEHYVRLIKVAHIVSEGRQLDADDITIQMSEDDRLIRTMALRGNSRITGSPGSGGAEGMSARDIDLAYAADGRTLQHANLVENAVARLAAAGGAARQVSGRRIDIGMAADGSTVTALNASENVQLDIPAEGAVPARRISSATLSSGGPNGLQTATFDGGVTYVETRGASRDSPAGERTGRSQRLVVETQPGLGAIQKADFTGNVHIVDGSTTGEGARAIYHVAEDRFDLSPMTGVPGPPPAVNDGRIQVNAARISFTIATKKLSADTAVRSSLQPSKRAGPGDKPAESGKLPSMLKPGEVVYVTANRLEYDGASALATYSGDARLWQDKTTIKGDTITVDDRGGNLTASGRVQTVMFFEEQDVVTKTRKLVQMDASGDKMVYEDARRLATYTTGPTAKAHIVGSQGDVVAQRIELFLKAGVNELERAEADGQVVAKEGFRTSLGNHLTYTASDGLYVMDGTPVEIEERKPDECSVTLASQVTFTRSEVSTHVTVKDNGLTSSTTKPCAAK